MTDLRNLEKKIRITFKDKNLLRQAFVHRSYLNENPSFELPHNERLEFLGDAVLELVVTYYLYKNYPNPEGELTNWRSALVKAETLSSVAQRLGLNKHLLLSRGETLGNNGRSRQIILANVFEALIGAIYLDRGLEKAKDFIEHSLIVELPEILKNELYIDAKSKFQELAQEKEGVTPVYSVLKESGPDHEKEFTVGAYLKDRLIGQGSGPSKQAAQQSAAADALEKYNK
ncbi:MAG: ribonuclease III [Candidatus Aenigmarchaeota archaeon]|nr:ribonuclease III [Candidatus Aenigmarchaeota archaeon]